MCFGDPGFKTMMRDTEVRIAPFVQAMNENRRDKPAATGWLARLQASLAGWMRKETRHV